jgi:acyl-ACP thioesterase
MDRPRADSSLESGEFVPTPARGRVYRASRRVHLGDVDGTAQLRLEAIARILQDLATDDVDDAGLAHRGDVWVVRRLDIDIRERPVYLDHIDLSTFCSGLGPRWAERRTTIERAGIALAEASSLWVFIDRDHGRPLRLEDDFIAVYGESAAARTVSGRLRHSRPPGDLARRRWALRESDFDVLDHVNNARYLEAVEDELAARLPECRLLSASFEYRGAVERGDRVDLVSTLTGDEYQCDLALWLLVANEIRMSARVKTAGVAFDGAREPGGGEPLA